jgi:adenylate cyclase
MNTANISGNGAAAIDSHPRQYPTLVTLVRRADRGSGAFPETITCAGIRAWLLSDAMGEKDLLPLFEALVWRMVAAGLPVDRITIHVGTLHPKLLGFYWNWNRDDGLVDELKVDQEGLDTERYKRSPLAIVIEEGKSFRARTTDQELANQYPILDDLRAQGIVDYSAFALGAGGAYHNAATISTTRDSGFSEEEMHECRRIFDLFALHVERQIAWRIAENVLDTYLGKLAGHKVLKGNIQRGAGESIRAIIWMSDLRGFSKLADHLPAQDVLNILNVYFELVAGAVIHHGGEILKFIGDGLLAVFPVTDAEDEQNAATDSLLAAQRALHDINLVNTQSHETLDAIHGWRPLRTGIALHLGEVFFGNVGAPERLDFTVIGGAVNEVSRVEALTRELNRSILITEPVAQLLDRDLENMGSHQLRGVSSPVTLYTPVVPG